MHLNDLWQNMDILHMKKCVDIDIMIFYFKRLYYEVCMNVIVFEEIRDEEDLTTYMLFEILS